MIIVKPGLIQTVMLLMSPKQRIVYYQCLIWLSLGFNMVSILPPILSIKFWATSIDILSHSASSLSHNSNIPLSVISNSPNLLLICSQRYSIGSRSGDCASHYGRVNPLFWTIPGPFCRYVWGHFATSKICKVPIHLTINLTCMPRPIQKHAGPHRHRSTSKLQCTL